MPGTVTARLVAPAAEFPRAVPNRAAPVRVLIVDDDDDVRETLSRMLADSGVEITGTASFVEARRALLANPFDVLLTDVRLGGYNGLQLAVIGRSECPDTRVVVMTGFDDRVMRQEAENLGAEFLAKPIARDALLTALRLSAEPAGVNAMPVEQAGS